jgi:hypothetical protein
MNLERVRVGWDGFAGAPGVSTFYFLDASSAMTALHSFYTDVAAALPSDVNIQVENTGDRITAASGALVGSWSGTAQTVITGGQAGSYAAPTGCVVDWWTGAILDAHRVRGRTFLVPLAGNSYQDDGSLLDATRVALQAAAESFRSGQASNFVIWHRPFAGSPAVGTRPARPAHDGDYAAVTSATVPDKACVLRSRRD